MHQIKQPTLQQIADRIYNKNQQSLTLYRYEKIWFDILMVRDWSMIKKLSISNSKINDDNITSLLDLNWPELTNLTLNSNNLTAPGVLKLMNKELKLESINLSYNNIQDEGMDILMKNSKKIVSILLFQCGLTYKGFYSMMDYSPKNLKNLSVSGNLIGNFGIKLLVKADLQNLQNLYLEDCGIGSEGMKHLSKGKWPFLTELSLIYDQDEKMNIIQMDGWQNINRNNWPKLNQFNLHEKQPILWIKCILLENSATIDEDSIKVDNQKLAKIIKDILAIRNISIL